MQAGRGDRGQEQSITSFRLQATISRLTDRRRRVLLSVSVAVRRSGLDTLRHAQDGVRGHRLCAST